VVAWHLNNVALPSKITLVLVKSVYFAACPLCVDARLIAPLEYPSIFSTLEGYLKAWEAGSCTLVLCLSRVSVFDSASVPRFTYPRAPLRVQAFGLSGSIGTSLWAIYEFASHRIPPMQALYTLRAIASFSANAERTDDSE